MVLEVTGATSGVTRKGVAYNNEITSPYTIKTACFGSGVLYPVSGKATVTPVDAQSFTVDFGNGDCDKNATIEVGSLTY